jgi:hypothetical protein
MKWLGQHIYDLIARFRNDVYLEDLSTTTETNVLVVDSDGKVSKTTVITGDVTGVTAGSNITVTDPTGPVPTVALSTNVDIADTLDVTGLGTFDASVTVAGDVGIGTDEPSGNLHISSGTSEDCLLIIEADIDNNDENDTPQIWFKADGGINEGLIGLNDNTLDLINNVSANGGIRFLTGSTNNTGTTTPYTSATERMRITSDGIELGHASDTTISRVSPGRVAVEGVSVVTTSSTDTLYNKTFAVGATFRGSTSGAITLRAAAVAGANTLTLPAASGTLATVKGEETLEGKTLTSPVINTPTGIVKGDVGLGNVDDTADSAKNVLSATKLTTDRTIGGISFDGSIDIPQRQITHHSAAFTFAVNTKQYIGLLEADSENITASNINLPFLAPFNGKLLKIFVRSSSGLTGGQLTLRLEKNALDVNAGGIPPTVVTNNPAAQLGPSNSTMTTYDWTSLSNTITAGDMIFISIESSSTFSNVNVKIFFTCLWEWDH